MTARELRDKGWTYRAIAHKLGVHHSTVYRWLNEDARRRNLALSVERNRRNRRFCPDCGKPATQAFCNSCRAKRGMLKQYSDEEILDALRKEKREQGRVLTERKQWPGYSLVRLRFGTWAEAMRRL